MATPGFIVHFSVNSPLKVERLLVGLTPAAGMARAPLPAHGHWDHGFAAPPSRSPRRQFGLRSRRAARGFGGNTELPPPELPADTRSVRCCSLAQADGPPTC